MSTIDQTLNEMIIFECVKNLIKKAMKASLKNDMKILLVASYKGESLGYASEKGNFPQFCKEILRHVKKVNVLSNDDYIELFMGDYHNWQNQKKISRWAASVSRNPSADRDLIMANHNSRTENMNMNKKLRKTEVEKLSQSDLTHLINSQKSKTMPIKKKRSITIPQMTTQEKSSLPKEGNKHTYVPLNDPQPLGTANSCLKSLSADDSKNICSCEDCGANTLFRVENSKMIEDKIKEMLIDQDKNMGNSSENEDKQNLINLQKEEIESSDDEKMCTNLGGMQYLTKKIAKNVLKSAEMENTKTDNKTKFLNAIEKLNFVKYTLFNKYKNPKTIHVGLDTLYPKYKNEPIVNKKMIEARKNSKLLENSKITKESENEKKDQANVNNSEANKALEAAENNIDPAQLQFQYQQMQKVVNSKVPDSVIPENVLNFINTHFTSQGKIIHNNLQSNETKTTEKNEKNKLQRKSENKDKMKEEEKVNEKKAILQSNDSKNLKEKSKGLIKSPDYVPKMSLREPKQKNPQIEKKLANLIEPKAESKRISRNSISNIDSRENKETTPSKKVENIGKSDNDQTEGKHVPKIKRPRDLKIKIPEKKDHMEVISSNKNISNSYVINDSSPKIINKNTVNANTNNNQESNQNIISPVVYNSSSSYNNEVELPNKHNFPVEGLKGNSGANPNNFGNPDNNFISILQYPTLVDDTTQKTDDFVRTFYELNKNDLMKHFHNKMRDYLGESQKGQQQGSSAVGDPSNMPTQNPGTTSVSLIQNSNLNKKRLRNDSIDQGVMPMTRNQFASMGPLGFSPNASQYLFSPILPPLIVKTPYDADLLHFGTFMTNSSNSANLIHNQGNPLNISNSSHNSSSICSSNIISPQIVNAENVGMLINSDKKFSLDEKMVPETENEEDKQKKSLANDFMNQFSEKSANKK